MPSFRPRCERWRAISARRDCWAAAFATLLGFGYATLTLAQGAQIEEIIVTASRRETTIQVVRYRGDRR
jgi:hypothetical protein